MTESRDWRPLIPGLCDWTFFFRSLLLRILIHAAASFAPQSSSLDVLNQQRRRPVLFTQAFLHVFENVQTRIQAHQIHQFEWTHGMIESELQGFVDILRGSDTFL